MKNLLLNQANEVQITGWLNKPSGALGIVGPGGSGKNFLARELAMKCLGVQNLTNNPGYIEIDAENGGIDDVREAQKAIKLVMPGTNSIKKVIFIRNFDAFGNEAQNAVLKTLEEPPADTVIIITVTRSSKVLPTVYSRISRINIHPVSLEQASKYYDKKPDELKKAYLLSDGYVGLMNSLITGAEDSELLKAIDYAKELLLMPKSHRLARVDDIIKNNPVDMSFLLDAILKLINATYKQAIIVGKSSKAAGDRLKAINSCIDSIQAGLSKKLALTNLFLVL